MTKEQTFDHPPRGHVALLAYDSANDRFQVVHVDASGLLQVDLAAAAVTLDINFASQDEEVSVTQTAADDLSVSVHGYDGLLWRKQPMIWGYYDRLAEFTQYVKVGAGDTLRTLFTVPDGYVYVVNATMSINHDKISVQNHLLYDGTNYYSIFQSTPTAIAQWQNNANLFYALKKDDKLAFQFLACDADDVLEYACWGYKMKIDM